MVAGHSPAGVLPRVEGSLGEGARSLVAGSCQGVGGTGAGHGVAGHRGRARNRVGEGRSPVGVAAVVAAHSPPAAVLSSFFRVQG